jgi:hypothetical protein
MYNKSMCNICDYSEVFILNSLIGFMKIRLKHPRNFCFDPQKPEISVNAFLRRKYNVSPLQRTTI